ncbi:urease accessory UreF family protein [Streptomyces sp. NPDC005438]|uniref:urease accessory protein UreF n=1 Tax=Streptomyces sp. NPDC005438 TaxID=3156880 RepID=UPI0033AFD04B
MTPSSPSTPPPASRAGPPLAALLLLADGRLPAGGHAHSGGAEAAVTAGRVRDPATLAAFCRGRLHTTGLSAAATAAAATLGVDPLALDTALEARTPSPALRAAGRRLGRQLLRAARATWPSPALDALARARPRGAHQPVVWGLLARSAGLGPREAAYLLAHESVSGPVSAAVRLLSLDPLAGTAVQAELAPEVDQVARRAEQAARSARSEGVRALPADGSPLLDIAAERHAARTTRLFAS